MKLAVHGAIISLLSAHLTATELLDCPASSIVGAGTPRPPPRRCSSLRQPRPASHPQSVASVPFPFDAARHFLRKQVVEIQDEPILSTDSNEGCIFLKSDGRPDGHHISVPV